MRGQGGCQGHAVDTTDLTNKVLLAAQQGNAPDVLVLDNPVVSTLADAGVLASTDDTKIETSGVDPNLLGAGQFGGKTYGTPIGANTLALFYNKAILQAAGVDPSSVKDWSSLTAALAKVAGTGKKGITFSAIGTEEGSFQFLPWFWGAGARLDQLETATFWVYSAADGYSDLAFRSRGVGAAAVAVNDQTVPGNLDGSPFRWSTGTDRVYLTAGVNKVVVTGRSGRVTVDELTATPVDHSADIATYQAEDGTLTGTAKVDNTYGQAHNGVVTGIGGGSANALTMTVRAPAAGTYAMTVRYANNQGILANHYNPDLMTAPADISVNGGPTSHANFANTFDWNQFWTRTVTVRLSKGGNTIRFIADQQYDWDGSTVGVIRSGSDVGDALRSDTAPNIDQITLAPLRSAGSPVR